MWDAKGLLFLSKGEFRDNLHQVCGRDRRCPARPVFNVESDVDVDVRAGGHRADDLRAGGLRGGLCGGAGLRGDSLCIGK